jgi:hypothetical protein
MEVTSSSRFSIFQDLAQISAGTHFWCKACVTARELFEQSENKDYCKACWQTIKAEKEIAKQQAVKRRDMLVFATSLPQQGVSERKDMKSIKVTRKG